MKTLNVKIWIVLLLLFLYPPSPQDVLTALWASKNFSLVFLSKNWVTNRYRVNKLPEPAPLVVHFLPAFPCEQVTKVKITELFGYEKCIIPGYTASSKWLLHGLPGVNVAERWMGFIFGNLPQPVTSQSFGVQLFTAHFTPGCSENKGTIWCWSSIQIRTDFIFHTPTGQGSKL